MFDFYASNPYRTPPTTLSTEPLSIPYAGEARMRLVIGDGLANAFVRVDPAAVALIRVDDLDCGDMLRLRADGETVRLVWDVTFGDKLRLLLSGERSAPEIVLHPAVEWSLVIRGGLAHARLDLTAGRVAGIEILGGCNEVDLDLPAASRAAQIRIAGGACQVQVRRPAGVGASVTITGGASSLQLDDQMLGAIGGRTVLHGLGAQPRYDIAVSGGASGLAIL